MIELKKIASADRDSGSIHDFTTKFIDKFTAGRYKLKVAYMGNTFYNVNSNNNVIYFNENSTNKSAALTPAFYNSTNIATAVATALTTASSGFATFTAALNSLTSVLTITSDQNFSLTFGTNTSSSAAALLGFAASNTSAATSQTGTTIVNLATNLSFNLRINNELSIQNKSTSFTFVIPILNDSQEIVAYEPGSFNQYVDFRNSTNSIQVQVLDDACRPIVLLSDFYFILERDGPRPE